MSADRIVLVILTLQALLGFAHGNVMFNTVEVFSPYHANIVRLACSGGEGAVSFYNRISGTISNLTLADGMEVTRELTLQIGPESEGEYFCEVGGVRSETVTLVGELWYGFFEVGGEGGAKGNVHT